MFLPNYLFLYLSFHHKINFMGPTCNPLIFGPDCQARLGDIHFSVCTDPMSGCENLGDPCWDTQIIVRFEYWCCNCSLTE
jgi:hypothetical protein